MVGQFGNDPAVIRTTFSCSLFYWSRTIAVRPGQRGRDKGDRPLHPFRAGRAHLDCVQLYTNAAFDSNVNSTPAVVPGIPTGDDCTKQCGRSHEEVNQLIGPRAETTSLICRLSASSRHGHSEKI